MYVLDNLLRVFYYEMSKTSQVNQKYAAYSDPRNEIKVLVEAKFKCACGFVIPWIL